MKRNVEEIQAALKGKTEVEVLVNQCYGGFSFSEEFAKHYGTRPYEYADSSCEDKWHRADPLLIQAVKDFGLDRATGDCARLQIAVLDNTKEWVIEDYEDGLEWFKYVGEEQQEEEEEYYSCEECGTPWDTPLCMDCSTKAMEKKYGKYTDSEKLFLW